MKYKFLIIITLIVLSFEMLNAQQSVGNYPYEWLNLGMSETPDKSQTIQWRTDSTMQNAVLQYKTDIPAPDLALNAQTINAISAIHNDYGIVKSYHKAVLENLLPDTKYIYRIGDGKKNWSEWIQFKSAKSGVNPFSFTYVADVQSGILSHYPRVLRKSIEVSPESSFYLFTGDLTEKAEDEELNNFFHAMSWIPGMKPIVAIPDNHEYHVKEGTKQRVELASVWGHLFSYPQNAPDSLARLGNYCFDYQGVRFIMLNNKAFSDNESGYKNQLLGWMEEKLKTNPTNWTIVAHHQPMYSLAEGRANKTNVKYLKPLYEKYGVDLVLSGHDHGYSRISNRGNFAQKSKLAMPVYMVSVAGEQMYVSQYPDSCDRMASNTQFFQKISISNNILNFKTYDAVGELYDEFDLVKNKSGKTIFNKIPTYDERTDLPLSRKRKYSDEAWQELENHRQEYLRNKKVK